MLRDKRQNRGGAMTTEAIDELEALGRVRLSKSFFMRDFLYSETAGAVGLRNYPDHPAQAIRCGRALCEEILEPLQAAFGRIHIRSGFRSEAVNQACADLGLNCAPNAQARGGHIWDSPDARGAAGAMACVVSPWLIDACAAGLDWREFAWWINDHLPYSTLVFYPALLAFNIAWSEAPRRLIFSRIEPQGFLTAPEGGAPRRGEGAYAGLLARLAAGGQA
jgi:hypothetical protein